MILTAARAFRERGYHNTSLDDIASELNVTKPTVYHYVENKEQLLFECFRAGLSQIMEGFDEIRGSQGSARERLENVITPLRRSDHVRLWLVHGAGREPGPEPGDEPQGEGAQVRNRPGHAPPDREGQLDGSIRKCDAKMTAFALAGALNWIAYWYRSDEALTAAEIAERFIELFDLGLQPRS